MLMLLTFFFYSILFVLCAFALIPLISFIIGVFQGVSGKNDNGFSEYVNSARWTDGK